MPVKMPEKKAQDGSPQQPDEQSLLISRMDHQWTRSWQEPIESDPVEGVRAIKKILELLEVENWSEKERFGIHMALEEAIMNAIKHGNQCHEDKQVTIDARVSATKFYILVRDEGPGFDPETIPDPTLDENLLKPSGRGVMLMRIYMTEVRYNDLGNQVELLKIRQV